jgi:hypothetical protein
MESEGSTWLERLFVMAFTLRERSFVRQEKNEQMFEMLFGVRYCVRIFPDRVTSSTRKAAQNMPKQ